MLQRLSLALFLLSAVYTAWGQDPFCETVTDQKFQNRINHILKELPKAKLRNSLEWVQVPVVFHIELENGNPVYSETTLRNKLSLVNTYFAPALIEFTNCQPILYYEATSTPSVSNTVNVYLLKSSSGCGSAIGSFVNINVSCNRTFEHILAHELGHVLGLPHTHGYTNSGTTNELADGSNCAIAGDRFCDTPADPNLLGKVNGSCIYTGSATDSNGDTYQPDTSNIMSYTRSTCADNFSQEQLDKMYQVASALQYSCCRINPPLVSDTTICAGQPVTITASSDLPTGMIKWYHQAHGGEPIATGRAMTTDTLHYSAVYYLEVIDSCISDRVSVKIMVNPTGGLNLFDIQQFADLNPESSQGTYFSNHMTIGDSMMLLLADKTIYKVGVLDDTLQVYEDTFAMMTDINLSTISLLNTKLIIGINDFNNGPSLWVHDLVTRQTQLLKSFGSTYGYSNYWLTQVGGFICAQLNAPGEVGEIWKTDGTTVGTQLVINLAPSNAFTDYSFTSFQGNLYFKRESSAYGTELWKTDGTAHNTEMVKDIWPGTGSSDPGPFVEMNGHLYFAANDSIDGKELWVTDGTHGNTILLKDINPVGSSNIYSIASINNLLYFSADDGVSGYELYKSDGTNAGTYRSVDLNSSGSSNPNQFIWFKDAVYFFANDGIHSSELFKEDPVTEEVALVKDINPGGAAILGSTYIFNDLLFFSAYDGASGYELWQSDGSFFGTQQTIDINIGSGSSNPGGFYTFNDQLFFSASAGNGNILWTLVPPDLEVCFGQPISLQANTKYDLSWYDAPQDGNLISQEHELHIPALWQHKKIYGILQEGACTSPSYELFLKIKPQCPCQDLGNQLIQTHFSEMDQFTISSANQLQTTSKFDAGSRMIFQAEDQIEVFTGFEVKLGAHFEAIMTGCE